MLLARVEHVRERERERECVCVCVYGAPINAAAQPTCLVVRDLSSRRSWLIRVSGSQPEEMAARLEPVTCTRLCELAARDMDSNGVGRHSGLMSARQLESQPMDAILQESISSPVLPVFPAYHSSQVRFEMPLVRLGRGLSPKIIDLNSFYIVKI